MHKAKAVLRKPNSVKKDDKIFKQILNDEMCKYLDDKIKRKELLDQINILRNQLNIMHSISKDNIDNSILLINKFNRELSSIISLDLTEFGIERCI